MRCFYTTPPPSISPEQLASGSFPSLRVHSKHESANMKCKPNCAPGETVSKTRLASCSGGILAGSTGECWRAAPARYWPDTWQDPPQGILSGILGGIHWRATLIYSVGYWAGSTDGLLWWDTWRDPSARRQVEFDAQRRIRLSMQSLLSSHTPQATRKPRLTSHNRVHGRKLVSVEGGDCSKQRN